MYAPLTSRHTVRPRQHQIQYHQIRLLGADPADRVFPIAHHGNGEAVGFQVFSSQVGEAVIVLDDHDGRRVILHGCHPVVILIRFCSQGTGLPRYKLPHPQWRGDILLLAHTPRRRQPWRWRQDDTIYGIAAPHYQCHFRRRKRLTEVHTLSTGFPQAGILQIRPLDYNLYPIRTSNPIYWVL